MMWRGALAVIIGTIAIVWPGITVGALVFLFAVYAFSDAIGQFGQAFAGHKAGPLVGHVLLALLDLAAGVVAIAWPGITAYALTIWVGAWALVTGFVEIWGAFTVPAHAGTRAALGLTGVVSVLFGVVVFAHPDAGALSLALLFGLFTLVYGVNLLVLASRLRHDAATSGTRVSGPPLDAVV
jgi:uncharacterized membrane protein HdeD (DUF308 family)